MCTFRKTEKGSIELIAMGILIALIVILAVPLLTSIGQNTSASIASIDSSLDTAIAPDGSDPLGPPVEVTPDP